MTPDAGPAGRDRRILRGIFCALLLIGFAGPLAAEGLRPVARPATSAAAAELATGVADDPAGLAARPEARPGAVGPDGALSDVVPVAAPAPPAEGPETHLPLPRYVSLKVSEGNVRRGPSLTHRIDWVFTRRDMPLQIVAEYGHWRRVIDREGLGGWVHYSLLSGVRTAIVDQDMLALRTQPDPEAPEIALIEVGVIARLGECGPDWCRITAGGYRGWAPKSTLWGVDADEIRS